MRRIWWLAIGWGLSACQAIQSGSNLDETSRAEVYRNITSRYPAFKSLENNKVMVGCVNWENSKIPTLDIRYAQMFYTLPFSDKNLGTGDLELRASNLCEEAKSKRSLVCDCAPLLVNDQVVLRVPDNVIGGKFLASIQAAAKPIKAASLSLPLAVRWEGRYELLAGTLHYTTSGTDGTLIITLPGTSGDCTGTWRYAFGKYGTSNPPQGVWSVSCRNGLVASGTYTSESPGKGEGEGRDTEGRKITIRYGDERSL